MMVTIIHTPIRHYLRLAHEGDDEVYVQTKNLAR